MKRIGPKLAEWYAQHAGEQASASKVAKLEARGERVTALVVLGLEPDPNGRISIEDERMAVACAAQNMYLTCTAHGIGGFLVHAEVFAVAGGQGVCRVARKRRSLGNILHGLP